MTTRSLHIKNMICRSCVRVLSEDFTNAGIEIKELRIGFARIRYNEAEITNQKINEILNIGGFSLILNPEIQIVEHIKIAVIELIHQMNNTNSIIQKSEYIVEKLGLNMRYLSKLFAQYEPVTLERFIILHKIEKIKQMIDSEEYTVSEISYVMDYSSVQYLSNQFKKETGMSVTEYKLSDRKCKKPLDDIYN